MDKLLIVFLVWLFGTLAITISMATNKELKSKDDTMGDYIGLFIVNGFLCGCVTLMAFVLP